MNFEELLETGRLLNLARALLTLIIGLGLARFLNRQVVRILPKHLGPQQQMVLRKLIFYGIVAITLVTTLRQLGFDLSVLLGAAGILTVAIGFASQTSASNLISGLFLLAEKPFIVGDVVRIGDTTGEVLSVGLLSTQLRTFDNLAVRIPNETMMKTEIVNLTRFPLRRIDLKIGVAYKDDLAAVERVLMAVAQRNPLSLDEPAPLFIVLGFGDSSIDLQLSVWTKRENFLKLKNSMLMEIKTAFERNGIEIPFPQRVVYLSPGTTEVAALGNAAT